ncbi:MAG: hypothetical protein ACE5JN_02070 [Candidatus Methylomirabilia bacterium]
MRQRRLQILLGAGVALALFGAEPVWSQEEAFKIVAPAPPVKPPEIITPGQPPEVTRPREADFSPDNVRTRHDPAFVTPLTKTVRTGPDSAVRVGVAGWTSPAGPREFEVPRENPGWFAVGFSIVWDVPLEPPDSEGSSETPR